MNVEWTTRTNDDVTLIEMVVTNDGPPRRVRVSNELDGPVWPPRTQGIPATGWNEHGYEGSVENRRVLGYATPAPAVDPPVSIEWLEKVEDEKGRTHHPTVPSIDPEPTPNSVYRTLSDPQPPRDAVPRVESVLSAASEQQGTPTGRTRHGRESGTVDETTIESLFEIIERRIDDGEMLTAVETRPDVTWALETVGGPAAVFDLMTALDSDRETLRTIEHRAARLRERAERVDVPVETLERLT